MIADSSRLIGWGIMGAGIIAQKLADAVLKNPDSRLAAVASRSPERAEDFADKFGIPKALSYEEFVADPDVDIVYVATTHNYHYDCAKLALEAGKPVLMEKPFTVNAGEAEALVALAREVELFLMEAMWVRFLPSLKRLKKMVSEGAIGRVKQATATFGSFVPQRFEQRLKDPDLAGGVTLDMGIYPISVISYILGEVPVDVRSLCSFSDRGVDESACYVFRYTSGCLVQIATNYNLKMEKRACFYGTEGYIDFDDFPGGSGFTIYRHNGTNEISETERIELDQDENGFVYQVAEAVRCLRVGRQESSVIPLDETVVLMRVMDGMRGDWGLRYPFE